MERNRWIERRETLGEKRGLEGRDVTLSSPSSSQRFSSFLLRRVLHRV